MVITVETAVIFVQYSCAQGRGHDDNYNIINSIRLCLRQYADSCRLPFSQLCGFDDDDIDDNNDVNDDGGGCKCRGLLMMMLFNDYVCAYTSSGPLQTRLDASDVFGGDVGSFCGGVY